MTEELKKHLSKLLSHSYQMGVSEGYVNGFKDAVATLEGGIETLESGNKITKKVMDDDLKKLWKQLEGMMTPSDPNVKAIPENPLDNTFLNDLIK